MKKAGDGPYRTAPSPRACEHDWRWTFVPGGSGKHLWYCLVCGRTATAHFLLHWYLNLKYRV